MNWSRQWKKAAKDWRRIAIRRGIKFRSRDAHKEIVDLQFYNLRTMCIKSKILTNAIKRGDTEAVERHSKQLEQTTARMWEFMFQHDLPWEE